MKTNDNTSDVSEPSPASDGSVAFGVEASMRRIEAGEIREADARLVVKRLRECRSKTARWCEQAAKAPMTQRETDAVRMAARACEQMGYREVPATLLAMLDRVK